jgi:RNA polymerase sigma-70 factor (ECF subfamily)
MPQEEAGPDPWSALMAWAQAGDREAYRRLLTGVVPYLRAVARQALRDPAEAEDAVQDVLLTLHAMRHVYDPRRPFKPWLIGIARHRIADRRRAGRRRGAREVRFDESHETIAAPPANETVLLDGGAALAGALERLPPGQRMALELLKLREMSLKEAAAASGMTVAALKVATHRGLARLRALLARAP